MKALIYKDLVTLKKTVLFVLVILAVICFIGIREGAILMLPFVFVIIPLILLGILFGSDAQSKVDSYVIPGPIKRSTIVLSRYSFVWLITIIGILFTILLKIFTKDSSLEMVPWYLIIATIALITTFIATIQLPLMYKFGAEQGKLIFVVLYFIIFGLFTYLGGKKEYIIELMGKLENLNLKLLCLAILGVTLVINAISCGISTKIYADKEF